MAQITKLMIMMVCIGAAVTAMSASGLNAETGLSPEAGIDKQVNDSETELRKYSASRQKGEVNFLGAVFSGADEIVSSYRLVFSLYDFLVNIGVPPWAAAFVSAPVYFSFGLFFIYLITGRRTSSRI